MRTALAAVLAALALLAAGCGDDDTEPTPTPGVEADGGSDGGDDAAGDVPEECRGPFPQAFGTPDLGQISLLPDGFPDPPVEAVLCLTSETVGGQNETASYATDASEEEVLAGYESALASFGAARETDGIGRPIVTATAGDVFLQVTPQEGGFVLAFSRG
ncbi:hypothetical protein ACFJIY_09665 [Pimelobacter simplex]|uniref:hypothetical protein n=1 Tax=Nocardioides simplex TaxID=2045 RepID=UPI0036725979